MKLTGGSTFGPYHIISPIDEGGMGEVFKARHASLDRIVALKVIRADRMHSEQALRRFHREMEVSIALRHPNLVAVYDAGVEQGRAYLAMEHIDGSTLDRWMEGRKFDRLLLRKVAFPLAEALIYLHEKQILHRDLKPRNVMVTRDGTIKLVDFGLAKGASSADHTRADQTVGTPHYMPPEVLMGQEWSRAGDRYSLGVLLYELCCARLPFDSAADLAHYMVQVLEYPPVPLRERNPDLSSQVEAMLMALIDRNPDRRPTLRQLLDVLERPPASILASEQSIPQGVPVAGPRGKGPGLALIAAGFVTAGAVLALVRPPTHSPSDVTHVTPSSSTQVYPPVDPVRELLPMYDRIRQMTRELANLEEKERQGVLELEVRGNVSAELAAKAAWELRRLLRFVHENDLRGAEWLEIEQTAGDLLHLLVGSRRSEATNREVQQLADYVQATSQDPYREVMRESLTPLTTQDSPASLVRRSTEGLERAIGKLERILESVPDTPSLQAHHLRLLDKATTLKMPIAQVGQYLDQDSASLPEAFLDGRRRQVRAMRPLPARMDELHRRGPREATALNILLLMYSYKVVEDHPAFDRDTVVRALEILDVSWDWMKRHHPDTSIYDEESREHILEAAAKVGVSLAHFAP